MRPFKKGLGLGLAVVVAIGAPLIGACFNYDEPVCSFTCGGPVNDPDSCPDDYECRTDGYCHRIGSTESCLFTDATVLEDASVVVQPDSAVAISPNSDAGNTDASGTD